MKFKGEMKRTFEYKSGKIKVIWNETPMEKEYEEEWITQEINKTTKKVLNPFSVGVELMVHTGPRMCYGMLMAYVTPSDEQDCIKVSVAYTKENAIKYPNSLLSDDRYVYKGLSEEYVEEVCNTVSEVINEKADYWQCDIVFGDAANCEAGSSPMFFRIITKIILELIDKNVLDAISTMSIADFTARYVKDINLRY